MKKVKNLTINVKFPSINKTKKAYITLMKRGNSKTNYIYDKEKFKTNYLKFLPSTNNSTNPITLFSEKNNFIKSFSCSNLYITKLPSEEKNKKINYENFGLQRIPPNKKGKIWKLKHQRLKKTNYKELKYIGDLLGIKEIKEDKNTERKHAIPLESRKDYFNFIRHKRNLFFNPNSTSNYVHEKSTNYLISSITKTKSYSILNDNKNIKKNKNEEILEMRDIVPNISYEEKKMINQIKNLFSQDFKFNNFEFNEDFYKKFENKINFLEDIVKYPVIKNNLVKIYIDKNKSLGIGEWKNINVISIQTWKFLNQLKEKMQREKDEKAKKLEEYLIKKREKEKEYEILEKKNKGKNSEKKNENDILKEEEKLKNIMADIIKNEDKKEQKFEDLYMIEEYFFHKNTYFSDNVSIASDRLRNIFFNNQ